MGNMQFNAKVFIPRAIAGFFVCGALIGGHAIGMQVADWARVIFDYHPECVYENWYDFVNGDFADTLYLLSWSGLVCAVIVYIGILSGNGIALACTLCLYVCVYIAYLVMLCYVWLFFWYIYLTESYLVHTCGGLIEVRTIWWMCLGSILMLIPAFIGCSVVGCYWKP